MNIPELVFLGDASIIVSSYVWNKCCVVSPDRTLSSFQLHSCGVCKNPVCHECATVCDICKLTRCCANCLDKSAKCHVCKGFVCTDCVNECCGKDWCTDCMDICTTCETSMCSKCEQYECSTCKETVCARCSCQCDVKCYKIFCETCLNDHRCSK